MVSTRATNSDFSLLAWLFTLPTKSFRMNSGTQFRGKVSAICANLSFPLSLNSTLFNSIVSIPFCFFFLWFVEQEPVRCWRLRDRVWEREREAGGKGNISDSLLKTILSNNQEEKIKYFVVVVENWSFSGISIVILCRVFFRTSLSFAHKTTIQF